MAKISASLMENSNRTVRPCSSARGFSSGNGVPLIINDSQIDPASGGGAEIQRQGFAFKGEGFGAERFGLIPRFHRCEAVTAEGVADQLDGFRSPVMVVDIDGSSFGSSGNFEGVSISPPTAG